MSGSMPIISTTRIKRVDYANALIDKLANWEFAAENLAKG